MPYVIASAWVSKYLVALELPAPFSYQEPFPFGVMCWFLPILVTSFLYILYQIRKKVLERNLYYLLKNIENGIVKVRQTYITIM